MYITLSTQFDFTANSDWILMNLYLHKISFSQYYSIVMNVKEEYKLFSLIRLDWRDSLHISQE